MQNKIRLKISWLAVLVFILIFSETFFELTLSRGLSQYYFLDLTEEFVALL